MLALRFVVTQKGQPSLPPVDLAGRIMIGSSPEAQLRLPASEASPEHVVIESTTWTARAPITVDRRVREAGSLGTLALVDGTELEVGSYVVRIIAAPAGVALSPPQRTESLAREMMRALLGGDSAPSLVIERGPGAGAKRVLPPPEATLVIGRGDEAGWVIADPDLSRTHAELRRTWDGISVRDLGSKNGTRVGRTKVGDNVHALQHDDLIDLGSVALRFRDPAEQHLRGGAAPPRAAEHAAGLVVAARRGSPLVFALALGVFGVAVALLAWMFVA